MKKSTSVWTLPGLWLALLLIVITVLTLLQPLKSKDGPTSALYVGLLVIFLGYLLSCIYSKDSAPWALARKPTAQDVSQADLDGDGHQVIDNGTAMLVPVTTNSAVSLSKLQTLLYFAVVIFVYVFTYTLRYVSTGVSAPLPRIPVEVLALIGLSVGTTVGAQALSLQYQAEKKIGESDKSDLIKNRDGNADLTKVQMLLWTFVSVVIYLSSFFQLVGSGCYIHDYRVATAPDGQQPITSAQMSLCKTTWNGYEGASSAQDNNYIDSTPSVDDVLDNTRPIPAWQSLGPLLPKFDPMLLLLAGVVQGTYLAGRFVVTRNKPKIDGVYRTTSGADFLVRIIGTFEGIYARPYPKPGVNANLYNAMLEVTNKDGQAFLVNLGDSATINTTKAGTVLDSTVKAVKAGPTAIILTNLLEAGKYSFRISVDGVWSDIVTFDLA